MIQAASGANDREMYQVFNMGTRLEIYTRPGAADTMIRVAESFGVEAKIIGRVEEAPQKELQIITPSGDTLLF